MKIKGFIFCSVLGAALILGVATNLRLSNLSPEVVTLEDVAPEVVAPAPILLATLPDSLSDLDLNIATRKQIFLDTLTPLILVANKEILQHRARTLAYQEQLAQNALGDIAAIDDLFAHYKIEERDVQSLLIRADVMPISVILAQAAIETGWGRSRFAREGQALFGMWTLSHELGMAMNDRDQNFPWRIRKYDNLMDSINSYYRNINTHGSYRQLRRIRYNLRQTQNNDLPLRADALFPHLGGYAESNHYIRLISQVIVQNSLDRFEAHKSFVPALNRT